MHSNLQLVLQSNDVTVQFYVDISNTTDTYNTSPFGEVSGIFLQAEVEPIRGVGPATGPMMIQNVFRRFLMRA